MSDPERRDPPWPYYTEKRAAALLGVDRELLSGLINQPTGPTLRAIKSRTPKGNWIRLYNRTDINALVERLSE